MPAAMAEAVVVVTAPKSEEETEDKAKQRGRGQQRGGGNDRPKCDMTQVECWECNGFGHFARLCPYKTPGHRRSQG